MKAAETEQAAVTERLVERPFQVSLRGLFGFTTTIAAAAAVVAAKGLGTLPLSFGLALSYLNVRGQLERIQTKPGRRKVFYLGWLLLAASLLLPAMEGGCNDSEIYGWQAAVFCAQLELEVCQEVVSEPPDNWDISPDVLSVGHLFILLLNLANLCLLLSPWLLWRLQRGQGRVFVAALSLAAVSVWFVPWDSDGGELIGYYAWCASITLLLCTCRISWRGFAAIVLLSAVLVIASFLQD